MDWSDAELVSWDLDGTLYDSDTFWIVFRRRVAKRLRFGSFWRTLRELWLLRQYRRWIAKERSKGGSLGPIPSKFRGEVAEGVLDSWISECIAEAGAAMGLTDIMMALSARGIRQIIVTDLRCMGKLDALKLPQCIEDVFEGESLGFIKPNREVFSLVLQRVGVPPGGVVHIGDRMDTDLPAARHHGISCLVKGIDFPDFPTLFATLD